MHLMAEILQNRFTIYSDTPSIFERMVTDGYHDASACIERVRPTLGRCVVSVHMFFLFRPRDRTSLLISGYFASNTA